MNGDHKTDLDQRDGQEVPGGINQEASMRKAWGISNDYLRNKSKLVCRVPAFWISRKDGMWC